MDLHLEITDFLRRRADGALILRAFKRDIRALTRHYPAHCFPLGQKDEDSYDDLAHEVFTTCAVREKGRFPFQRHTPFCHFSRSRSADLEIRRLVFFNRISVARELLREVRRHNLVRDPREAWQTELFQDLAERLPRVALPAPGRDRWWLGAASPDTHLALVERQLARWAGARHAEGIEPDPDEALLLVLQLRSPLSRSQLSRVLSAVLNPHARWAPPPEPFTPALETRLLVREAVMGAWAGLDDEERDFLIAVVSGLSGREAAARFPHLRTDKQVSQAIRRCNARFIEPVAAQIQRDCAVSMTPRQLADLIYQVLIPMLESEP